MPGRFDTLIGQAGAAVIKHLADSDLLIGAGPTAVRGLWRAPHVSALDMLDVSSPSVTILDADFPGLARDDEIVRGGTTYRVIGLEPDGFGMVTARLEVAD